MCLSFDTSPFLISYGKPFLMMFFLFQFIHHGYGKVFNRYVAVSIGIHCN